MKLRYLNIVDVTGKWESDILQFRNEDGKWERISIVVIEEGDDETVDL